MDDVANALASGTIIENYPTDFPFPSALWLGFVGVMRLHLVAADNNMAASERIIITVYRPDPSQWGADWSTPRTN